MSILLILIIKYRDLNQRFNLFETINNINVCVCVCVCVRSAISDSFETPWTI